MFCGYPHQGCTLIKGRVSDVLSSVLSLRGGEKCDFVWVTIFEGDQFLWGD